MNTPKVPDEELITHLQTIYATLALLDEGHESHEKRLKHIEAQLNAGDRA